MTSLPRRIWFWIGFEFVVLAALACVRAALWTYGSDTGTFAQIVADAFNGMRNGVENGTHFRYHWSPSLGVLWPLVALTRSALSLQIVQAAATVACAPLLAALALPYAGKRLSESVAILALLYPPLLALGFDEFHELGLYSALVLGMFVAADRGRWPWFAICGLMLIGLREDAALTMFFFGAVASHRRASARPRKAPACSIGRPLDRTALAIAGAILAAGSIGVLLLYYGVIAPHFGGWKPETLLRLSLCIGSVRARARTLHASGSVLSRDLTFGRLTYVLEALVPLLFLPLRSWWSLLALPGAAVVLLANSGYVWRMGDHYAALWIPWLLVGTVIAIAAIARKRNVAVARRWMTGAAVVCAVFLVAFDPMHPLHYLHPYYHDLADARRALACVPKDAELATYDEWFSAQAAQRPRATIDRTSGAQYLVYADDFPSPPIASSCALRLPRRFRRDAIASSAATARLWSTKPSAQPAGKGR